MTIRQQQDVKTDISKHFYIYIYIYFVKCLIYNVFNVLLSYSNVLY